MQKGQNTNLTQVIAQQYKNQEETQSAKSRLWFKQIKQMVWNKQCVQEQQNTRQSQNIRPVNNQYISQCLEIILRLMVKQQRTDINLNKYSVQIKQKLGLIDQILQKQLKKICFSPEQTRQSREELWLIIIQILWNQFYGVQQQLIPIIMYSTYQDVQQYILNIFQSKWKKKEIPLDESPVFSQDQFQFNSSENRQTVAKSELKKKYSNIRLINLLNTSFVDQLKQRYLDLPQTQKQRLVNHLEHIFQNKNLIIKKKVVKKMQVIIL